MVTVSPDLVFEGTIPQSFHFSFFPPSHSVADTGLPALSPFSAFLPTEL